MIGSLLNSRGSANQRLHPTATGVAAGETQRYADMRGSRYEVIRAELRLIPALVFIPARLALNARDVARSRYACA
jgi:hypothetical protein